MGPRPQKEAFSEPSGPRVGLICSHFRPSRLHIDAIRRHFGPRAGGGTKYINGPTDIFGTPPPPGGQLGSKLAPFGLDSTPFWAKSAAFCKGEGEQTDPRARKLTLLTHPADTSTVNPFPNSHFANTHVKKSLCNSHFENMTAANSKLVTFK